MTARAEVAHRGLVAAASAHLTTTIAADLPFEDLGAYKTALKHFFSDEPWTRSDADALSELVSRHVPSGEWSHPLDADLTLHHGVDSGRYEMSVEGAFTPTRSLWDRVFDGPVRPEPTPHPSKVKFSLGGEPAPGVWYLREGHSGDDRVDRLFAEPDVTDVMVAGDFVTVGLRPGSSWEARLDPILELVGELFATGESHGSTVSRDELIAEGQAAHVVSDRLHLLDPDDPSHRMRLRTALDGDDARSRRVAVAVLAGSNDPAVVDEALSRGRTDDSLIVRRMAVDAAADAEDRRHRDLLVTALEDPDPWTRWRAVRGLGELRLSDLTTVLTSMTDDPEFQVRFEAERVLRDARGTQTSSTPS